MKLTFLILIALAYTATLVAVIRTMRQPKQNRRKHKLAKWLVANKQIH